MSQIFNFYSPDYATVVGSETVVISNVRTCQSSFKTKRSRAKRKIYYEEEEEGFDVEFGSDFTSPESLDEAVKEQNEDLHPDFQSPDVSPKRRRRKARKNSTDVGQEAEVKRQAEDTQHVHLVEAHESAEVCVKKEEEEETKVRTFD